MNCKKEKEYQMKQEYDYDVHLHNDFGFALEEFNAVSIIEDVKRLQKQLQTYGWELEPSELCEVLWGIG